MSEKGCGKAEIHIIEGKCMTKDQILTKTQPNLRQFLNPGSIAVLGASPKEQSIGWRIIYNLQRVGYLGTIYPINPKHDSILGLKTYGGIREIQKPVDMAIVALSARNVLDSLEECREAGVRSVIVISAGFAEMGGSGSRIQRSIAEFARRTGIRVLGPNCQGLINFRDKAAMSFSGAVDFGVLPGTAGIVSQSGSMGHALYNIAIESGIGLSYLITTGNEADLDSIEFMEYLVTDPGVNTIVGYIEGFKRPGRLPELGEQSLVAGKPIVMLKPGKSEVAQKAIKSHTAALAGSDEICDVVLRQSGIIRVNDVEELLDAASVFSVIKKYPDGNRVAICTTSGGAGVLLTDACYEFGLAVPGLRQETRDKLRDLLPSFGSAENPVDVTAQIINDQKGLARILSTVLEDPGIDVLVVGIGMAVGRAAEIRAKLIWSVAKNAEKPVFVVWVAGEHAAASGLKYLKDHHVPCFQNPWRCARALGHVVRFRQYMNDYRERLFVKEESPFSADQIHRVGEILDRNGDILTEYESKGIMAEAGFPVVRERLARTEEEAVQAADSLGYPVVMKVHSPEITHKTESGGIRLNIGNADEVRAAFGEITKSVRNCRPDAVINGVMIQEMVAGGTEVIVGSTWDAQFGPIIMFGLGGIYVEIARDIAFRQAPITRDESLKMILETKIAGSILKGARGRAPADIDALCETISRLSHFSVCFPEHLEVDLNPVIVLPQGQGVKLVDALIVKTVNNHGEKIIMEYD